MSRRARSWRRTSPSGPVKRRQRSPSHLTSKKYSLLLNGASAEEACIGRMAVGNPPTSIESWSGLEDTFGEGYLGRSHAPRGLRAAPVGGEPDEVRRRPRLRRRPQGGLGASPAGRRAEPGRDGLRGDDRPPPRQGDPL